MQEISRRREKPSLVGINVLGVGQEPFDFNYGLEKGSEGEQKTVASYRLPPLIEASFWH